MDPRRTRHSVRPQKRRSRAPIPVTGTSRHPGTTGRHLRNAQTIQGNGAKPTAEPEAVVQDWEGSAAEWLGNISMRER
jgi:hypothetical protein